MPCGRFGGACAPFAPPWVRHWTRLIIAIKDNGFLALSSIAAPIYVLHIRMCRKVPLLRYDSLTLQIDNTKPLLVSDHPRMFINAGVNIKV